MLPRHLRGYNAAALRHDTAAGLNVALPAIAQGMAFSLIAGLPHEVTGIVCSAVAAITGALFAASRYTILGPTNATSLMVFSALSPLAAPDRLLMLPALVLMAGLLLMAGAALRIADLIQYISRSVIVGYITGAAILIAASQLRDITGLTGGPRGSTLISMAGRTVAEIPHLNPATGTASLLIAAVTILLYVLQRKFTPRLPALAVSLAAASGAALLIPGHHGVIAFLQPFTPGDLLPSGRGLTLKEIPDSLSHLTGPAFALAFLAALENTVMGRALPGEPANPLPIPIRICSPAASPTPPAPSPAACPPAAA